MNTRTISLHCLFIGIVKSGAMISCLSVILQGTVTASTGEDSSPPPAYLRGEVLRIGNEVQLLVDDYIIEDRWKLTRKVGNVVKHLGNPVIVQDKPWEGQMGTYPCALYDEQTKKFRIYYDSFNLTNYFTPKSGAPSYSVCYAESEDGVNWTKPLLDGFPYGEYPRTNVVNMGIDGRRADAAQVMLNPDQSDPEKRFMIVYLSRGARLAYSSDGIHWKAEEKPMLNYHSDFPNHLVWVPEQKLWYLYCRPFVRSNGRGTIPEGPRHTSRRLALTTSSDLKNWSQPRIVLYPDERDEPDYDGVYVFRRHGVFIAMYAQMKQEPPAGQKIISAESESDVYIATSRDGVHWQRTWDRKPFLARGQAGTFDGGQVGWGMSPPIQIGEQELFYYFATPKGQSHFYQEASVGMARMRRDRFIGQYAGELTGYLLTKEFILDGSKLVINASAFPKVYYERDTIGIRVEIFEAPDYDLSGDRFDALGRLVRDSKNMQEKPVKGFSMEDCDPIITENTAHVVTWKGKSDLSALKGRRVFVRFKMRHAGLYSFQIAP